MLVLVLFRSPEDGMEGHIGCTDSTQYLSGPDLKNQCLQWIFGSRAFPRRSRETSRKLITCILRLPCSKHPRVVLPKGTSSPKPCSLDQDQPVNDTGSDVLDQASNNFLCLLSSTVSLTFFHLCCPFSSRTQVQQRGNSHLGFTSDCHRSVTFTQGGVKWCDGGGRSDS